MYFHLWSALKSFDVQVSAQKPEESAENIWYLVWILHGVGLMIDRTTGGRNDIREYVYTSTEQKKNYLYIVMDFYSTFFRNM